jgi:FMN phosphatase YigB (HAD superfamily)
VRGQAPPAAVTFDCWKTLLYEPDWTLAHARRVAALVHAAAEAGRRTTAEEAGRAFDAAWARHMQWWREGVQTGAHEVALDALAELGLAEPHPALEHLVSEYREASHSGRVRALDDAPATLEALARAGVRLALVCDTGLTPGTVVRRHLERVGLLAHLEVCAFSDEIGVPKPAAAIFRAALDPLGVVPADAVHVGDLRRTDVAGARALGMRTVRIRARHDDESELPEADAVVDSHAELARVLGVCGEVARDGEGAPRAGS